MIYDDERPHHHAAISALHRTAFNGDHEAGMVERLRDAGHAVASVVAEAAGEVIGHIMFSPVDVTVDGRRVDAVALAPLAVRPDLQGRGIGSRLVIAGLVRMRAQRRQAVLVRGNPEYYPRFGFRAALIQHLSAPWQDENHMGLELAPAVLAGSGGTVRYPAAFHAP